MRKRRSILERLAWLGLAALLLVNGGCLLAVAGAAAGGAAAAGYVYYKGNLYREYSTRIDQTVPAVRASLAELQYPVLTETQGAGEVTIASRAPDGSTVRVMIDAIPGATPADAGKTRISVRVGLTGDEPISARVLDQISQHIVPLGASGPGATLGPPSPIGETAPPPLAGAPAPGPGLADLTTPAQPR